MNLKGIVSVSGKPGLWKALAQNKTGFILESLDGQKTKLVVNLSTAKLAALEEITIFGDDDDLKLIDVLEAIKANAADVPDTKADGQVLRKFFRVVAPGHDEEKVYASDMKKIINWYNLIKELPLFHEVAEVGTIAPEAIPQEPVAEPVAPEAAADEKPKKAAAKKAKPAAEATADAAEAKPKATRKKKAE
jgi:hypothetical protein